MKKTVIVLFLVLFLVFSLVGCGGGSGGNDGNRGNDGTGGSGSDDPSSTPTPPSTQNSDAQDPVIYKFEASSTKALLGTSIQFTADFQNGTGVITPGNIRITSGIPISLTPTVPTTYVLKVTDKYGSWTSAELNVNVYLEGKYTYNLASADPIEAHFSFFSTGVGNFSWQRTFPLSGDVDAWAGTFNYTIKGSSIDLYWTNGRRSGTHSTIDSFGSDYVMFEGARYRK